MSKNNIVKINILQLKYILYNSNISNEEMVRIGTMIDENKEVLELHKYKISETTDGRWRTSIPGGKRLTKPTYEELLKALIPVYIKEAKTATMALLFDEYIARQVEDCRTPATVQKKIYSWNTFLRDTDIVKKPIANIKIDELRSFILNLIKDNHMKQKYFNSWLKPLLNGILDIAVEKELIADNKLKKIKLSARVFEPAKALEIYENVFTDDEESAMIDECWKRAEDRQNAIPLGLVILFRTGLRIGELCALQWKHVDLAQNCLYVRQILKPKIIIDGLSTKNDGYEVSEFAKTQKSRRTVVYSNDTVDVFREIERYNIANGYGVEDEDFIFRRGENCHADTTADLCNDRVFDDRLRKWCKYLDFPYAKSPHDIRRTFASKCFENGLDATDIQLLLGHEELSTTLSYIKNRKAHKTMVEKMNRVFKCA